MSGERDKSVNVGGAGKWEFGASPCPSCARFSLARFTHWLVLPPLPPPGTPATQARRKSRNKTWKILLPIFHVTQMRSATLKDDDH